MSDKSNYLYKAEHQHNNLLTSQGITIFIMHSFDHPSVITGVKAKENLFANSLRSLASHNMKILSPTKSVILQGPKGLTLESFGGNVTINHVAFTNIKSKKVYNMVKYVLLKNL